MLALDVKLGPASSVSLESGGEGAGVQSTSGVGGKTTAMVALPPTPPKKHDSSKTLFTVHTPSMADHTYGASKTKTPDMPAKPRMMFSPKATASLTKFMGMSNDEEGTPWKRRGGSANREVPFKKAKVDDDSDSYSSPTPSKSDMPKKGSQEEENKEENAFLQ